MTKKKPKKAKQSLRKTLLSGYFMCHFNVTLPNGSVLTVLKCMGPNKQIALEEVRRHIDMKVLEQLFRDYSGEAFESFDGHFLPTLATASVTAIQRADLGRFKVKFNCLFP